MCVRNIIDEYYCRTGKNETSGYTISCACNEMKLITAFNNILFKYVKYVAYARALIYISVLNLILNLIPELQLYEMKLDYTN